MRSPFARYSRIATNFLALIATALLALSANAQSPVVGQPLPEWTNGTLDIHHINTGRGNAAFCILPDGTTLLIDAGELDPTAERTLSARNAVIRPNNTKAPFEWIAEYIQQFAPQHAKTVIDYALITHFHDDHFGGWYPGAPKAASGKYFRSGITGIADLIPVHLLLTRDYHFPIDPDSILSKLPADNKAVKSWANFKNFISDATAKGMRYQFLQAGSSSQIRLVHAESKFPNFEIRNIKSNGLIWTGRDSIAAEHFTSFNKKNPATWPDENALSNAIVIRYDNFRYYTGGDNPGNVFLGDSAWRDVESAMAPVIGAVDVATMDHHGNRDAVNATLIKTLQPRVWVEQVWTADHPGHEVLIRVMSKLYDGPRDLFATNMLEANKLVIGPLIDQSYKSEQGHIVVRVLPGRKSYYVVILDDATTSRLVKTVFGPYAVKGDGLQHQ